MPELHPIYRIPVVLDALDYSILQVLLGHQGRNKPISRYALLYSLTHFKLKERVLRERIKCLRRAGFLIGSAPGEDGGYYLIANSREFDEFMHQELMAKIADMSETAKAMRYAAAQQFGITDKQIPLL